MLITKSVDNKKPQGNSLEPQKSALADFNLFG